MRSEQLKHHKKMKMIRQFHIEKPVDHQIRLWAKAEGFKEGNPAGQQLMDEDNHAYCFHKPIDASTVCVLIDTLDREIRIEAWVLDEMRHGSRTTEPIGHLLDLLE